MKAFPVLFVSIFVSVSFAAERCIEITLSENPYADKTLICGAEIDVVIGNLQVTKNYEQFLGDNYSAELQVRNNNSQKIMVRSLLAKFIDDAGDVIGLCSQDVSRVIESGERNEFSIECKNYKFLSVREKEVFNVLFTATPHSGT